MIGRQYFARRVKILLKYAQSATDSQFASTLNEQAADLKSMIDELSAGPDPSLRTRDVQPVAGRRTLNS
jgi:hypothetical protein